jgi:hypothetical protein
MWEVARDAEAARGERERLSVELASHQDAAARADAAMELLGEREERIAELEADMLVRPQPHACCSCVVAPEPTACVLRRTSR